VLQFISGTSVNVVLLVLGVGSFALKAFALGDALLRPAPAFPAAGKLTKVKWCAIVGAAFVVNLVLFNPLNLLNLVGVVAALVYLVDVRPALQALGPGGSIRRGKGGGYGGGNGPTGW